MKSIKTLKNALIRSRKIFVNYLLYQALCLKNKYKAITANAEKPIHPIIGSFISCPKTVPVTGRDSTRISNIIPIPINIAIRISFSSII